MADNQFSHESQASSVKLMHAHANANGFIWRTGHTATLILARFQSSNNDLVGGAKYERQVKERNMRNVHDCNLAAPAAQRVAIHGIHQTLRDDLE